MDYKAMVEYQRYRVRYKHDDQRKEREFVGTFLGKNIYGDLDFSLRPAAGTSSIPANTILDVEPVGSGVPNSIPKVVI